PIIAGTDEAAKKETRATTAWVMGQMLKFLHPFMPYITEELWDQFVGGSMLMTEKWPVLADSLLNKDAQAEIGWLVKLIGSVRTIRVELNVPAAAKVQLQFKDAGHVTRERIETHKPLIMHIARVAEISHVTSVVKGAAQTILDEATVVMPLAGVI